MKIEMSLAVNSNGDLYYLVKLLETTPEEMIETMGYLTPIVSEPFKIMRSGRSSLVMSFSHKDGYNVANKLGVKPIIEPAAMKELAGNES